MSATIAGDIDVAHPAASMYWTKAKSPLKHFSVYWQLSFATMVRSCRGRVRVGIQRVGIDPGGYRIIVVFIKIQLTRCRTYHLNIARRAVKITCIADCPGNRQRGRHVKRGPVVTVGRGVFCQGISGFGQMPNSLEPIGCVENGGAI